MRASKMPPGNAIQFIWLGDRAQQAKLEIGSKTPITLPLAVALETVISFSGHANHISPTYLNCVDKLLPTRSQTGGEEIVSAYSVTRSTSGIGSRTITVPASMQDRSIGCLCHRPVRSAIFAYFLKSTYRWRAMLDRSPVDASASHG